MAIEPLSEEELARHRRLADHTWLPHYERFLATIADLQTQLREAQEERDEVNETLILIRGRELEAISRWRGEDVQRYLKQPDYGELLDWLNGERIQAQEERGAVERDKADALTALAVARDVAGEMEQERDDAYSLIEAAERDAKAMGALADTRLSIGLFLCHAVKLVTERGLLAVRYKPPTEQEAPE